MNKLTKSLFEVYRELTVEVLSILQHTGNCKFKLIYKNVKCKDFMWGNNFQQ